jgi:hypothetical protein
MLKKTLKIVMIAPILMMGASFRTPAEEVKPNIHHLTGDQKTKSSNHEENNTPTESRVPGEIHKSSIGLGIGQTFLRGDFADHGNDKITPDIYFNYSASYSFDFLANFHWSDHEFQGKSVTIKGLALSIKGKGFQYDAFAPFLLGGFGFYLPSAKRLNTSQTLTPTRDQLVFGMNFGAGVELRLNEKVCVGVIAHYHDPFTVRQETNGPFDGSYMKLLLTGMYTFN